MGVSKKIESPEKLKEYFSAYEKDIKGTPFLIKDWVGKDAEQVQREKERPLTMEGFECWLSDKGILQDLGDYLKNKDGRYEDYAPICSYIKKKIRKDQIEGGMAGMFNPSITQRLNGLVEKTEDVTPQQPKKLIIKIKKDEDN
jgi:hypothetical protein